MERFREMHASLCAARDILLDRFLDLLFPKSGLVQEIEGLSPTEFVDGVTSLAGGRRFRGHYPPECAEWSSAILAYRDRHVRAAVWELKYRKNAKVASIFAELLAEELKMSAEKPVFDSSSTLIVPIPLSEKRRRERGYNQIELILERLPRSERWTVTTNLLHRTHNTVPQTTLSRAKRLRNLTDCFEVTDSQKVANKRFILIDDVMTTGSTLQQAREALLRAGAGKVTAITMAH